MRIPHHLYKHPAGVYYFQLAIPEALRSFCDGKRWVRYSLNTKNPAEAKIMAYSHTLHWLSQFQQLKSMKKPTVDEILSNPDLTDFKLGKAKGAWTVAEAKDTADYDLALREIGRLDSLGIKPEPTKSPVAKSEFVPKHKVSIREGANRWLAEVKQTAIKKTFKTKSSVVHEFCQFIGFNTLIHTIGKKELSDYKLKLFQSQDNELRTIAQKFNYLAQFFEFLKSSGLYLVDNPAKNQVKYSKKQKLKDTDLNKYLPWSSQEIKQIFLPDRFINVPNPHMFWGCLIAYFTGMRVNEVCQLLISDIDQARKTIYINVSNNDQSLKSIYSRRLIPIHPSLIEIGFFDYVNGVEELEELRLFPYIIKNSNGFGDRLTKDFANYLKKHKLKQPRKAFHSWRSTINNKMADKKVPADFRSVFLGQEFESVNLEHYTEKYSPENLFDVCLGNVVFEIDVAELKRLDKNKFITHVKKKKEKKMSNK